MKNQKIWFKIILNIERCENIPGNYFRSQGTTEEYNREPQRISEVLS